MINYNPLSVSRKKEVCSIMAIGNVALAAMAESLNFSNTKEFRKFLFRHKFSIKSMSAEINMSEKNRLFVVEEIEKVKRIRNIESELLSGYCNIVRDLANKYYRVGCDDYENYVQEGYIALIDAIYGYKDESIEFSTFCYTAIKNHLLSVLRYDNQLSPLSRDAVCLKRDFEKCRKSLGDFCQDEEIFEKLSWTKKQIELYRHSLVVPVQASMLFTEKDENFDYSSLAKDVEENDSIDFLLWNRLIVPCKLLI